MVLQKWQQPFPQPNSNAGKASTSPTGAHKQAPAAFQQGRIAYRAGRYVEAEAAFAQAVNQEPDHLWSWLQWANSQRRQNQINTAITTLEQLATNNADLPMLSRTHGQTASPTTLGKEIKNVAVRLERQYEQLRKTNIFGIIVLKTLPPKCSIN